MENHLFIGREKEIQQLNQIFSEANNGLGKLVLFNGNPGSGKSGLIREFLKQFDYNDKVLNAITECNDKEGINAHAAFKDLLLKLNSAAVSSSKESRAQLFKKLKSFVSEAGAQWIGMIPVVGGVAQAGLETYKAYQNSFGNSSETKIESEIAIYQIFENEFRRLASDKTVIIFLDDLQWVDSSSLNLLFALAKNIRENPFRIMIIGTYRQFEIEAGKNKITESGTNVTVRHPFADILNELRNYTKHESHIHRQDQWLYEIEMKPFTLNEIKRLVQANFTLNHFNDEFYELIFKISDGHPLYLVEMLEYLVKTDKIKVSIDGSYICDNLKIDELPVSVQAIISEKIERLSEELKKVLSYASVNGEEFAVPVVEKLLKIDELDLLDYLEQLSKKHGLLVANEPIHVKNMLFELYSFSQTLVHKYIYENLDGARRRALHRKIAETLVNLYGDELDNNKIIKDKYNLHTQIGQGLIDGISLQLTKVDSKVTEQESSVNESLTQAARDEVKAAFENFEQFAMTECHDRIDKALGFLSAIKLKSNETDVIRFEALKIRNKAQQWSGFYEKAHQTAQEMLKIANEITDNQLITDSYVAIGKALHSLGQYELAINQFSKAIELYQALQNRLMIIECLNLLAMCKESQALYNQAIEFLDQALIYSKEIGTEAKIGETIYQLATCHRKKGSFDTAMDLYKQALNIFEKLGNQKQIGLIYNHMGLNVQGKGEYYKSIEYIQKALDIAVQQNDKVNISNRLNNIGLAHQAMGNTNESLSFYSQTLVIDTSLNDKPKMAISFNNIGGIYTNLGQFEKALEYFNQSLEIYKLLNNKNGISFSYSCIALNYYQERKYSESKEYYVKCIEIDKELGDNVSLAGNYIGLGNVYYTDGNNDEAREYYIQALELYKNMEDEYSMAIMNNNLGNIEHSLGKYYDAIGRYKLAFEFYKKTEDKPNTAMLLINMAISHDGTKEYSLSEEFYKSALAIYTELKDVRNMAKTYASLGITFYNLGDYKKSIDRLEKSNTYYNQLNSYEEIAVNYQDMADAYHELNDIKSAISFYKKAININTENDDKYGAAKVLKNLAIFYERENDYENAIDCCEKELDVYSKIGNKEPFARIYCRIAFCYKALKKMKKAKNSFFESIEIAKIYEQYDMLATAHKGIGSIYQLDEVFDEAVEMYLRALEFHQHFDDPFDLADTYYNLGYTIWISPQFEKDYQNAMGYFNKSLEIFTQINDFYNISYCFYVLGNIYYEFKNYEQSLIYLNKAKESMLEYDPEFEIEFINDMITETLAQLPSNPGRPGPV